MLQATEGPERFGRPVRISGLLVELGAARRC
jgi:hypothetical protein